MKTTNWILAALVFATMLALWASNNSTVRADERVRLDKLPLVVRATIEQHTKDGRIKKIEKDKEDGQIVYEAEVILDGKEVDILVSESGKLLRVNDDERNDDVEEQSVNYDVLPDAVKNALDRGYAGIQFEGFSREVEDGYAFFEAAYEDDNEKHEIKLTPDGHVIESEIERAYAMLPAEVRSAIESQYTDARIEANVEMVQQVFYEIALKTKGGDEYEIKVLANGQILEEGKTE